MTAKKKVLKILIILILAIFLLSTGLISVLYLGGTKNTSGTGDLLSGDVVLEPGVIDTGIVDTEVADTGIVNKNIVPIGTVAPIIIGTGNN